jgi:hypothetical protein
MERNGTTLRLVFVEHLKATIVTSQKQLYNALLWLQRVDTKGCTVHWSRLLVQEWLKNPYEA